ncbi:hypothetical protein [Nocardioides sp. LHG3406-4]|uniref:hypothetical protein n=1 Tax=Nocardioides sp. LHG3406-4 TaxID=2804575 RepID=UPI003CF86216
MREILGACLSLGVPGQLLADCLGTSRDSVRNRAASPDGVIAADLIQWLTDLSPAQLDRLAGAQLHHHLDPQSGAVTYSTADVIRALLNTPRRDGSVAQDAADAREGR